MKINDDRAEIGSPIKSEIQEASRASDSRTTRAANDGSSSFQNEISETMVIAERSPGSVCVSLERPISPACPFFIQTMQTA